MQLNAYAKINWDLHVLGKRADGFHALDMVMVNVSVHDVLTLEPATDGKIALTCSDPTLPTDDSNLVVKAARALAQAAGTNSGATIHLEKHIPAGGGMGGGSSDCAATLLGLNKLWKLNWPVDKLQPLAASLGSDVAFFLYGGWQRCLGRGEIIEALPGSESFQPARLFLIFPPLHVSTPAVYKQLRYPPFNEKAPLRKTAELAETLKRQLTELTKNESMNLDLKNDLTPAALAVEPKLARIQAALEKLFPGRWLMSGSGAVHFVVARANETSNDLTRELEKILPGTRVLDAHTR